MTAAPPSDITTRFGSEERSYLLRRGEEHRQLAERTQDAGSRAIHLRLHQLYTEQAALVVMVLPD